MARRQAQATGIAATCGGAGDRAAAVLLAGGRADGCGGSYLEFLPLYLGGHGDFCKPAGPCLVLPTWSHLWFLPYLMVYTLVLWASARAAPRWLERAGHRLSGTLSFSFMSLLFVPWLVLAMSRLALRPWFDVTHALVDDPLAHAQYLPAFLALAGAILASTPGAWPAIARLRVTAPHCSSRWEPGSPGVSTGPTCPAAARGLRRAAMGRGDRGTGFRLGTPQPAPSVAARAREQSLRRVRAASDPDHPAGGGAQAAGIAAPDGGAAADRWHRLERASTCSAV